MGLLSPDLPSSKIPLFLPCTFVDWFSQTISSLFLRLWPGYGQRYSEGQGVLTKSRCPDRGYPCSGNGKGRPETALSRFHKHKRPCVGFELDTNYKLNEADVACGYSARFQSIIGNGVVRIVEDIGEKKKGILSIMKHNTGKLDWEFSDKMLDAVCVFKMDVNTMSCKEHL